MKTIRVADDCCLFCSRHGNVGGGHVFIGKRHKDGSLRSSDGWMCIEHQSACAIQICPDCLLPLVEAGKVLK